METNTQTRKIADYLKPNNLGEFMRTYGTFIVLILLCIISTMLRPQVFPTVGNLMSILVQVSMIIILACGESILIIGGQVDLAAGSVVALAGTFLVGTYVATGNLLLALIAALTVGALSGLVSGFFVAKFQLPAFIVTLGVQILARGFAYIYSNGMPISIKYPAFKVMGQGSTLGVPNPIWMALVVVIITWILMNRLKFGRAVYAIGGNIEAAKASGIRVNRVLVLSYVIMGVFSAIAGYVLMSRLNVGQPNAAYNYEFDAIIGTILGGTSFSGGVGTIGGSVVGCLIMGVLANILNLINVPPNWQYIAKGVIILVAVTLDYYTKNARMKK